jgi:hypothetical protein
VQRCHSKQLSGLNNVLQRLTKQFKGFGSGFIELHAKLDEYTLLASAIYRRQTKHEAQKAVV